MASALLHYSIHLARLLSIFSLFAGSPEKAQNPDAVPALVRVNIIIEIPGAKNTVELNGKLLADYSPTIVQDFLSAGVVLDGQGHIMTFLGYRWVDIQGHDPRIVVTAGDGQKWKGKLVGIDQSNGVAVLQLLTGRPRRTPVCAKCEIRDGATIVSPVIESPGLSQFREAQILSVGAGPAIPEQDGWIMAMNHLVPDVGQPILTPDHQVLGFVAGQDPLDMKTVVYPIAPLLSSAEKILKAGGDIRVGWLGVFLMDSPIAAGAGVAVQGVEPDSPAQKSGLEAQDLLLNYNGQEIRDARQFIRLVQGTAVGSKANIEIMRQGRRVAVTASVEARRPRQNPGRLSFSFPGAIGPALAGMIPESPPRNPKLLFGIETLMLTPELADALQMPGQMGLLVTDVAKRLPADLAGVLVGDVITTIDGQPIVDAFGFASFWETHAWGAQPVLKILRRGAERTIAVHLRDQGR